MKNSHSTRSAFTSVELLIVMVVIGILAAIPIVGYRGIQSRANIASVRVDLKQAVNQLNIHRVDNNIYPTVLTQLNNGQGLRSNPAITYQYTVNNVSNPPTFCLTATLGTIAFNVDPAGVMIEGVCSGHTPPTSGGSGSSISNPTGGVLASGGNHTCALKAGAIKCWGEGNDGKLGNGLGTNSSTPVNVTPGELSGKTITSVAAGSNHSCAFASSAMFCWGYGFYGSLGQNTTTNVLAPTAVITSGVLSGKAMTAAVVGSSTSCAIASGQAFCWGYNADGQVGNNTTVQANAPVAVSTSGILNGKTIDDIDTSGPHTCALANGASYCWGNDQYGGLGNGTGNTSMSVPVETIMTGVMNGKSITNVDTGGYITCAIASGELFCWGWGGDGTMGNGTETFANQDPVAVTMSGALSGKTITDLSVGGNSVCVVASGGVFCWGRGSDGRLGNGSVVLSSVPVAVNTSGVLAGKTMVSVSVGGNHACANDSAGAVYCWGNNNFGQLGNGTIVGSTVPVAVTGL